MAEQERGQKEYDAFWKSYFDAETENYKKILSDPKKVFSGKLSELAAEFNMDEIVFAGFIDGINSSLKKEYRLDSLKSTSKIDLNIDLEKLYKNMLNAKANWLYELPEWDPIFTEEKRKELAREYKASKMYVKPVKPGPNEPCPCGSGKKYKKCCGRN